MVFLTLGRRQGDAKVNEMGEESVITSERRFRRATMADLPTMLKIYEHARKLMASNGNPTQWGDKFPREEVVRDDVESQRTSLRKGIIGFVFQSFNLIDELNVYENIELPLLYMGVSASERKRKIEDVMNRMAIAHRAKHFPQQLSGGQQQRVAIARAVVTNPQLILADEPTGNLDSKNGREVMELLTELNKEGTTIVMVTHSQHDAGYANRIINLFDGEVVTEITI